MVLKSKNSTSGKTSSTLDGVSSDGDIPMRSRLKAWWNGEDAAAANRQKLSSVADILGDDHDNDLDETSEKPWSRTELAVIQMIWGEGFIEPGGAKLARSVLGWLQLNAKQSVLDLTAGLGGTARSVSTAHGLWMDATEPVLELADEGRRQSNLAGMAKQVPITAIDLEEHTLSEARYDAIYSRERLFAVKNKANLFAGCAEALKPRGQILITDYMRGPEIGGAELSAQWGQHEKQTPHTWTLNAYKECLAELELDILISQDITDDMIESVHSVWRRIPTMVADEKFSHKQMNALAKECEIWLDRVQAMESGILRLGRIHAQKRSN